MTMFRFTYLTGFIACVLLSSGCSTLFHHPKKKKTVKPEQHQMIGDVAMVNSANAFVLVNIGTLFQPPPPGMALKCFREQKPVAILTVSHERNPPFIVANIIQGTPKQGDEVAK